MERRSSRGVPRGLLRGALPALALLLLGAAGASARQAGPRLFVSVDMEGIGGIGTPAMTSATGKDYATGRRLMTDEVNAVLAAIYERSPSARVLVNDSHGDMQNLLHTELDPRAEYVQGSLKPLGMVQGLDGSFDGMVFLGYHARAGDPDGFLAHTGSGIVKGLWVQDVEVGEGGLNALFAGHHGVPVLVAAGDSAFTAEIGSLTGAETVTTKIAESPASARLRHPEVVRTELQGAVRRALGRLDAYRALETAARGPVRVRIRFDTTLRADVLEAIPGVERVDGWTVAFEAPDMDRAYRMIRLMYRYVQT